MLVFSAGIFHNFLLALSDFSSTFFLLARPARRTVRCTFVKLLAKFSAEFSCYCRNRIEEMNGLINTGCLVSRADQTAHQTAADCQFWRTTSN